MFNARITTAPLATLTLLPSFSYRQAVDPRHPSLGMRILSTAESSISPATPPQPMDTHKQRKEAFAEMMHTFFPSSNGTYSVIRKLAGVAEGSELAGKTALECNQEFLNAVSFQKVRSINKVLDFYLGFSYSYKCSYHCH